MTYSNYWDDPNIASEYIARIRQRNCSGNVCLHALNTIKSHLENDRDLLIDLGSGPGNVSGAVLSEFPFKELLMIDSSEVMLSSVPSFVDSNKTRIRQQVADLAHCRFDAEDESADLIVADSLSFLQNLDNVILESTRVLKSRGIIQFSLTVHDEETHESRLCERDNSFVGSYAHSYHWLLEIMLQDLSFKHLLISDPITIETLSCQGFAIMTFAFQKM
jgi:predicted TPR repeat methyltransferase